MAYDFTMAHEKTERIERGPDGTFTSVWACTCGDEFDSGPMGSELEAQAAGTTSWSFHLREI